MTYREKQLVRHATKAAVKAGKLVRPKQCDECGHEPLPLLDTQGIEAHHEDYSKRFEVEWLCFTCHQRRHGKLRK